MATAPDPSRVARAHARANGPKKVIYRMTFGDRQLDLDVYALGPGTAAMVRKATGLKISTFLDLDDPDLDSLAVLWWLARCQNGERSLSWRAAEREFATYADFLNTEDQPFRIDVIDENGDPIGARPDAIDTTVTTLDEDQEAFPDPEA